MIFELFTIKIWKYFKIAWNNEKNKVFINSTVDTHVESSTQALKELILGTGSTKESVDTYSTDVIKFKDEVPPVSQRKTFPYSTTLSATPAKEEIYEALNIRWILLFVFNCY